MDCIIQGLKEWPAFHDLKKIIDDFTDICPILELMSNKEIFSLCSNDIINPFTAIQMNTCLLVLYKSSKILKTAEPIGAQFLVMTSNGPWQV